MSGYSGTPLQKKLGIKPGSHILILNAPTGFNLGDIPEDVTVAYDLRSKREASVNVLFCPIGRAMSGRFDACVQRLSIAGGLWIAWPKKSSGVSTDLHDKVVRSYGLDQGLVDNKMCAIDDTWSALRFVRR